MPAATGAPATYQPRPGHILGRLKQYKLDRFVESPFRVSSWDSTVASSQPSEPNRTRSFSPGEEAQMYSHLVSVAACCALALGTTSWLETPPTAHPTKNTATTPIRLVMARV